MSGLSSFSSVGRKFEMSGAEHRKKVIVDSLEQMGEKLLSDAKEANGSSQDAWANLTDQVSLSNLSASGGTNTKIDAAWQGNDYSLKAERNTWYKGGRVEDFSMTKSGDNTLIHYKKSKREGGPYFGKALPKDLREVLVIKNGTEGNSKIEVVEGSFNVSLRSAKSAIGGVFGL